VAVAFCATIWWEMRQLRIGHRPILNLTLFKRPNFSISFILMFVLGFSLYGTTILIPQFVQTLLGYTAELAGLVLSPAGLMMMCMMPVVGILVGKVDPRKLIAYGFLMLTISLITMHTMNLDITYGRLVFLRCFQASGLAFLFIPINTIAYIGVKQSENNDVSGLTNLARNIGGSCGTAFFATMLTRRSAAHETNMIRNLTSANPEFINQVMRLKPLFGGTRGGGGNPLVGGGSHAAQAFIYNQLHRQAGMLAYLDVIQYLTVFCACMLPLLFFIPRPPKHVDPSAGH
jgi:MFS transporter, DHA2 family, multidrug resistance protein